MKESSATDQSNPHHDMSGSCNHFLQSRRSKEFWNKSWSSYVLQSHLKLSIFYSCHNRWELFLINRNNSTVMKCRFSRQPFAQGMETDVVNLRRITSDDLWTQMENEGNSDPTLNWMIEVSTFKHSRSFLCYFGVKSVNEQITDCLWQMEGQWRGVFMQINHCVHSGKWTDSNKNGQTLKWRDQQYQREWSHIEIGSPLSKYSTIFSFIVYTWSIHLKKHVCWWHKRTPQKRQGNLC